MGSTQRQDFERDGFAVVEGLADVVAQFWLALDDIDETMGCMEFIPGGHRAPMP